MIWGTDTETTGSDLRHGCRPFMVASCNLERTLVWEWDVDPETRRPLIPAAERRELRRHMRRRHVMHNSKFDIRALETIKVNGMDWSDVEDTHVALHVLASGETKKLKEAAMLYLDWPDDDMRELQEAVNEARRYGRQKGWRIATEHDPHWPAMKKPRDEGFWVWDMWLPRAVAKHKGLKRGHPWWTVARQYCVGDAERTVGLWLVLREALQQERLTKQYRTRMRTLPIFYDMETRGVSVNRRWMRQAKREFMSGAEETENKCYHLANGHLASITSTDQLRHVLFDVFKLDPAKQTDLSPKLYLTEGGQLSTNKDVLNALLDATPPRSRPHVFMRQLQRNRKFVKGLEYLESYLQAAVPTEHRLWSMLLPSFNAAGTKTTRGASHNPNAQNISKQELINLRRIFGPLPGRCWWSIDYENIELRIFAYKCGDKKLIKAFEDGYSVHLIVAELLFPKEFRRCERDDVSFKDKYKSTLYQWVKNGNFSLIYGAGRAKADSTYHLSGAYDRIRKMLPRIDRFMQSKLDEAKLNGYVELPGGYRLQVPVDEPHKAVNYFVQGTAGWCITLAMIRVAKVLRRLRDFHMIMMIHDELDFDFPDEPRGDDVIQEVAAAMELSGHDVGLPTPVDVERHPVTWAEGEPLRAA